MDSSVWQQSPNGDNLASIIIIKTKIKLQVRESEKISFLYLKNSSTRKPLDQVTFGSLPILEVLGAAQ